MARVLIADYKEEHAEKLEEKLKESGIDVDRVPDDEAGLIVVEDEPSYGDFIKSLRNYRILIAHLGVGFQYKLESLIYKFPNLQFILVSDTDCDYHRTKRARVFDYESENLIPFIKKVLSRE